MKYKIFLSTPFLFACSAMEMSSKMGAADYDESQTEAPEDYYDEGYPEPSGEPNGGAEADDGFGSETESDFMSLRPATTNVFVFVTNPDRNTVTRIKVPELEVMTAEVGVEPLLVETSSDYTRAVTFNNGSDDISIIDAETLSVSDVSIRSNLNQMKMSPDGKWVVCYHDVSAEDGGTSSGGAISFNAISIVDLEGETHFEAMAGAYPHDVQYTEDGSMAVVISDDYLTALDFSTGEPVPRRIAIADDLINPPKAEEVLLDPEGRYAIVRQYGVNDLVLVDFAEDSTAQVSLIEVGANPTDMDVSPSGEEAIVVARGSNELWIYDLENPTLAPSVIPMPQEEVFGSLLISPDDDQGILYSTATGLSRMAVWERDSNDITVRGLVKPIASVGLSPTGDTAVISHPQENGDVESTSQFYNAYALSLVDMSDLFTSAYKLSAKPESFASTPDGKIGFFILENQPYLELLNYETFVPSEVVLPSVPVHLGTLPDTNIAFVSQEHDLGRLSFFDTDEDQLQTITGFELNSAIEH